MNKQSKTLIVAAVLMGTGMGAMADESLTNSVRIEQQVVRFGDLDLGSRAGVAALHQRLRMAAANVCEQDRTGLTAYQQQIKCRNQALEHALASVPGVVASYHAQWKANGAHWLATPETSAPIQLAAAH